MNRCKTFFTVLCLTFIAGCNQASGPGGFNEPKVTFNPPVITSGTAKPVIIPLSSVKAPEIRVAGAPLVEKDSLDGGAPFFTHFNSDNGLVTSAVNCMLQDHLGDIWFGTQGSGASRYDGRNVTTYTAAQGLSNTIVCMLLDKKGDIWFGTSGGGAVCYDGKAFKSYTIAQGLPANIVTALMQDRAGNIWITTSAGLSRYDGEKIRSFTTALGPGADAITSVMEDKSGDIWVGKLHAGAVRFDGKHFTDFSAKLGLTGFSVMCMMQDKKGRIWFGTARLGLKVYDGQTCVTWDKSQALADNYVANLLEDKKGNIWVGTGTEVSRYDGINWKVYNKSSGLPDGGPFKMAQNNDGDVWFGISGKGICRFDGTKFIAYGKAQGLLDDNVAAMLLDHNGLIWVSYGADISRYDGKAFTSFEPKRGSLGIFGSDILQDRTGNIWFSTYGNGVVRYDGKTLDSYGRAQGLASNSVNGMTEDKDGRIWFTTDSGVSRYDGKTFTNYTAGQGLANDNVYGVMQDSAGDMWFGTWGGGVSKFNGKSFTNYNVEQGLAFSIVDKLMQDRTGTYWFCTGNGVSKFNGRKFTNYTKEQGLAGNVVISCWADSAGNSWFGTGEGGINMFDSKGLMHTITLDEKSEVYAITGDKKRNRLWFGLTNGLAWRSTKSAGTFNRSAGFPIRDVNALMVDKKGVIWTECGNNRIIRFDYDKLDKHPAALQLMITSLKVNGKDVCWNALLPQQDTLQKLALVNEMETTFGKKLSASTLDTLKQTCRGIKFDSLNRFYPVPADLTLPYGDRNLTINFVAIAPDWPKRLKYSYWLQGYDKDWSAPSDNLAAVLGNIPEGKYTFRVKATTAQGVLGTAEYSFEILAPWYRTWWAWLCYVCLLVGTVYFIVQMRSGQLIRQKQVLELIVKERTGEVSQQRDELETAFHELRNTQSQLIQAEKMASLGQLTTGIAHEIQNPLNFVNNFSEVNAEMIDEIDEELQAGNIEEASAILSDLRENEKKITYHGQRAQSIVKGMLEHGRAGGSAKELTDLNKLLEEQLRLSYQQSRTKNPGFEAELILSTDPKLPEIDLIAADMARVLMNLLNNSFYAMNEKRKKLNNDYRPVIKATTIINDKNLKIIIEDNGVGIPVNIMDKIMQPFFTTKPTGEGVGMGLSLAYDIIVNAYKGKLEFQSKLGEGAAFSITLPA